MLSPEEWHERHHRPLNSPVPTMEQCWRCAKARTRCGGKITYPDAMTAWEEAKRLNLMRGPESLVRSYRCRYCLCWHLTKRLSGTQAKRAEKHRRKQLRPAA